MLVISPKFLELIKKRNLEFIINDIAMYIEKNNECADYNSLREFYNIAINHGFQTPYQIACVVIAISRNKEESLKFINIELSKFSNADNIFYENLARRVLLLS